MSRHPYLERVVSATLQLRRRRWLAAAALLPVATVLSRWAEPAVVVECKALSDWVSFTARHVQEDGRVVDLDTPQQQSTSEGQSYGLFFALVHNDRALFDRLLAWTEVNLCGGSLASRLPAWQWGKKADDSWGVLDANPASDADLWIAYALLEAGRLWSQPSYRALGKTVLSMVERDEVILLPELGRMLLPWPRSVAHGPGWRLNPSYLPLQLLRRFHQEDASGPWSEIAQNTVRMLGAVTPRGFAPDWCIWSGEEDAFGTDPQQGTVGSYDAIRVYLWAGMLNAKDPAHTALLKILYGPRRLSEQGEGLPEHVDTLTGAGRGTGPAGYGAALLPYLKVQYLVAPPSPRSGELRDAASPVFSGPVASSIAPRATPLPYYERMLTLFGQGWLEGVFAFGKTGYLQTHWRLTCHSVQPA